MADERYCLVSKALNHRNGGFCFVRIEREIENVLENVVVHIVEALKPDTFHPVNFGEADYIISRAKALVERTKELRKSVPAEQDAGFFSQVYLPVVGTMNVELMQLYSGKNRWFAQHNALVANVYADKVRECVKADKELVDECDKVGDGRFFGMAWSEHFGFNNWCEAANSYPVYAYVEPTRKKRNIFWIDGDEFTTTGQDWTRRDLYLDAFKNPDCTEARIKLANCNETGCEYTVALGKYDKDDSKRWINGKIIKDEEGLGDKTACIDTILLTIDREKLAKESDKTDNYSLHLLLKFNRIEDILLIHEFLHVNWVALFVLYFYVLDV